MKPAVLCISRTTLDSLGIPPESHEIHEFDVNQVPGSAFHFINREIVDTPNHSSFEFIIARHYPQILGYVVLKNNDKYLTYARKQSGESRLLGNRSIGFGGHVDLEDYGFTFVQSEHGNVSFNDVLRFSTERELFEELELSVDESSINYSGLIVDTTNPVGQVHVGLLAVIEVDPSDVHSTPETQDLQWLTKDEILAELDLYENWSQIAIKSV